MLIAAALFGLSPLRNQPRSKTMLNLTLLALVPILAPAPPPPPLSNFSLLAVGYPSSPC